ncbi:hypothetical protein JCM5350_001365 [Sporobolomyces pararoseus]
MSLPRSAARLPDELIVDIFRSNVLSNSDLFRASLVSRRFVDDVNRTLYEHCKIHLIDLETETERYIYSTQTWKLLRTLIDHKDLAKFVRSLEFKLDEEEVQPGELEDYWGMETTTEIAVSGAFRLMPNVKTVEFGKLWDPEGENLEAMSDYDIKGLVLREISGETLQYVAQNFPQLEHLATIGIVEIGETTAASTRTIPTRLQSLSIKECYSEIQSGLISANTSTLRNLELPLEHAVRLTYSTFTALEGLRITSDSSYGRSADAGRNSINFWKSLSDSPSLRTLSFGSSRFSSSYEKALFGGSNQTEHQRRNPIATLRNLRFEGEIHSKRADFLLSGPLASTLNRVTISTRYQDPQLDPWELDKLRSLASICELRGIELAFADD